MVNFPLSKPAIKTTEDLGLKRVFPSFLATVIINHFFKIIYTAVYNCMRNRIRLPGYQFVHQICKCVEVAIPMNNSESAFGKVIALSADNDENQKFS